MNNTSNHVLPRPLLCRALGALMNLAGRPDLWTEFGPSGVALALAQLGAPGVHADQRTALLVAMTIWCGPGVSYLALGDFVTALRTMDQQLAISLCQLLHAVTFGARNLEDWTQAAETGNPMPAVTETRVLN
ncbi:MAG: hypothetical protein WA190_11185 [Usitatibacter sp.]